MERVSILVFKPRFDEMVTLYTGLLLIIHFLYNCNFFICLGALQPDTFPKTSWISLSVMISMFYLGLLQQKNSLPQKAEITQIKEEILYICNDARDNISRIKSASWKVLGVSGASYWFFNSDLFYVNDTSPLPESIKNLFFCLLISFFLYVVCYEYPSKLQKYRVRLKNSLYNFSEVAKRIHGDTEKISAIDMGDKTYFVFCYIFLSFFYYLNILN